MKQESYRKSFLALTVLGTLLFSNIACSDNRAMDVHEATVEVEEREPTEQELQRLHATSHEQAQPRRNTFSNQQRSTIAGVDEILDALPQLGPQGAKIAVFGKAIWKLIEGNQPVVNVRTNRLSVMPRDVRDWSRMSGWSNPRVRAYTVRIKNGFGIEVVKYDYAISFNHSGSLGGRGKYLANVTVINNLVHVLWGWNLDAEFAVTDAINVGTPENPIPAVQAEVRYKMHTVINRREVTDSFFIGGDGRIQRLNRSQN